MTSVPVSDARAQLSRLIDQATTTHERFEITRNGRRAAVLLSADDYDTLRDTIAVLSDVELLNAHREGGAESRMIIREKHRGHRRCHRPANAAMESRMIIREKRGDDAATRRHAQHAAMESRMIIREKVRPLLGERIGRIQPEWSPG